jgi:hypothetical protein
MLLPFSTSHVLVVNFLYLTTADSYATYYNNATCHEYDLQKPNYIYDLKLVSVERFRFYKSYS